MIHPWAVQVVQPCKERVGTWHGSAAITERDYRDRWRAAVECR
jgi:hypothetical protein